MGFAATVTSKRGGGWGPEFMPPSLVTRARVAGRVPAQLAGLQAAQLARPRSVSPAPASPTRGAARTGLRLLHQPLAGPDVS